MSAVCSDEFVAPISHENESQLPLSDPRDALHHTYRDVYKVL